MLSVGCSMFSLPFSCEQRIDPPQHPCIIRLGPFPPRVHPTDLRFPMQPAASPLTASNVSGTGMTRQTGGRGQFSAGELAVVMSHFDIGVIDSIVESPRGSRKAPKLLIVSEQGKFLLKRRARGKDDP